MKDTSSLIDPMAMYGRTGLLALSGFITDEWDIALQGFRGRRMYREMADQDATIGGLLYAFEMLIRQTHWPVTPYDDSAEAVANATFLSECLADMDETFPDTLAEILTMLVYGWSYHEVLYKERRGPSDDPTQNSKYTDGKVGWRSWAIRSQESLTRWEFAEDNTLLGMWQIPPPDYRIRYVPYAKSLLFRPTVRRGNPEGRSILRNAFRSYYLKKNIETVESIGVERDLVGFPVIYAPGKIVQPVTPEDQAASDAYYKMITNIRRDEAEGALLPSERDDKGNLQYELKLTTSGGTRVFNTNEIIQRHATQIAQSALADFLQLGHNARGAQSLSQSKMDMFNTSLVAIMDSMAAVINNRAVAWLMRLNGITDKFPSIGHGEIQRADILALGQMILNLYQAGAQLDLSAGSPILTKILEEANLPPSNPNPADGYGVQQDNNGPAAVAAPGGQHDASFGRIKRQTPVRSVIEQPGTAPTPQPGGNRLEKKPTPPS